jgi:carbon-monoxide dehydrogenase medium subunit
MKPSSFEYVLARSVTEATDALSAAEEATVLAGGQSLVPLMNLRLARPDVIVDINAISDLARVEQVNGSVRLGALCRQRTLETDPDVRRVAPLLAEAASLIGHVQIRNRGTLGGSLAHADPVSELPTAVLALDGEIELTSGDGSRRIGARDLAVGALMTTIKPGELLTGVVVSAHRPGDGVSFVEFARRHGDFALVGIAAVLHRDEAGICTSARLAGAGLAGTPTDLTPSIEAIVGADVLSDDLLRTISDGVAASVDPWSDIHGSSEYRRELAQVLVVEAIRSAWARTEEQP